MLHLTFYRGVPFDREQQNVLFVDNEKRNEFLTQYIVPIQTLRIDQFALLGSTNNPFLVVSLDKEPFNVNYLKVIQSLQNANGNVIEERLLFYYVDNYEMVGTDAVRLNLTMDYFQTYFNGYDMTTNQMKRPEIKNALVTQGHGFEQGGEIEEILKPNSLNENFEIQPLFDNQFRAVIHMTTKDREFPEIVILGTYAMTYENALKFANDFYKISQVRFRSIESPETNVSILNSYIVPESLINFEIDSTKFCYVPLEDANMICPIPMILNDGTYQVYKNITLKNSETEEAKVCFVGTGATNIEIPYNSKPYEIKFITCIANDFSIEMWANNQMLNITNDFEINVIYDEYANYMNQSKQSRAISKLSKQMIGVAGVASGLGSIFKGDIGGGAERIGAGLIGSQLALMTEEARLNDMKTKPLNLINDTNTLTTIAYLNGVSIFKGTPVNYNEIIKTNKYFGFGCNGFNETLNLEKQTETQKFRFCQCAYLSMIGDFNFEIKERLESYFTRGIRLWYDKDTFLNGFEP